jgi:hypothetical protein
VPGSHKMKTTTTHRGRNTSPTSLRPHSLTCRADQISFKVTKSILDNLLSPARHATTPLQASSPLWQQSSNTSASSSESALKSWGNTDTNHPSSAKQEGWSVRASRAHPTLSYLGDPGNQSAVSNWAHETNKGGRVTVFLLYLLAFSSHGLCLMFGLLLSLLFGFSKSCENGV